MFCDLQATYLLIGVAVVLVILVGADLIRK